MRFYSGWITNALAEKEEFDHQLQELQKICSPIMAKIHQGGQGHPEAGSKVSGTHGGPTVEEVD